MSTKEISVKQQNGKDSVVTEKEASLAYHPDVFRNTDGVEETFKKKNIWEVLWQYGWILEVEKMIHIYIGILGICYLCWLITHYTLTWRK